MKPATSKQGASSNIDTAFAAINSMDPTIFNRVYPPTGRVDVFLVPYLEDTLQFNKLVDRLNEKGYLTDEVCKQIDTSNEDHQRVCNKLYALACENLPNKKILTRQAFDCIREKKREILLGHDSEDALVGVAIRAFKVECSRAIKDFINAIQEVQQNALFLTDQEKFALGEFQLAAAKGLAEFNYDGDVVELTSAYFAIHHSITLHADRIGLNQWHAFAGPYQPATEYLVKMERIFTGFFAPMHSSYLQEAGLKQLLLDDLCYLALIEYGQKSILPTVTQDIRVMFFRLMEEFRPCELKALLVTENDMVEEQRFITQSHKEYKNPSSKPSPCPPSNGLIDSKSVPKARLSEHLLNERDMQVGTNLLREIIVGDDILILNPTNAQNMLSQIEFITAREEHQGKTIFGFMNITNNHWITLVLYRAKNNESVQLLVLDPAPNTTEKQNTHAELENSIKNYFKCEIITLSPPLSQQDSRPYCGFSCLQTGKDIIKSKAIRILNDRLELNRENLTLDYERDDFKDKIMEVKQNWEENFAQCSEVTFFDLSGLPVYTEDYNYISNVKNSQLRNKAINLLDSIVAKFEQYTQTKYGPQVIESFLSNYPDICQQYSTMKQNIRHFTTDLPLPDLRKILEDSADRTTLTVLKNDQASILPPPHTYNHYTPQPFNEITYENGQKVPIERIKNALVNLQQQTAVQIKKSSSFWRSNTTWENLNRSVQQWTNWLDGKHDHAEVKIQLLSTAQTLFIVFKNHYRDLQQNTLGYATGYCLSQILGYDDFLSSSRQPNKCVHNESGQPVPIHEFLLQKLHASLCDCRGEIQPQNILDYSASTYHC